ncbi:MAG: HAD-IA family hydrolase [Bacteroidaceae bacterium]|nr:HAD-IA family hydrolase [Bacteroidaceae bacterium]
MKLASFDIFDTTLIRKCGKPENIFYILANKLYPNDKAKREDFLLWRKRAENEARRRVPGKDVTIDDIYSSEELKGFDEYTTAQLIEAEKSIEAEQLIANPAIRDVIKQKREQGYTICFISDMYLPSEMLKEVLLRERCIGKNEMVYVSCEWNARKSNGALYKKLKEKLKSEEWEHFGDHPVSDVKMAKHYGIKATKVNTDLSIAEKSTIAPRDNKYHYESSILAGLSRAARIHFGNNAYTTIAADFVAPAYIPYVHFALETAKEKGIKTLYFLSRDSYILQRIAEQMSHEGIELRYLFVSRKALLLPYLDNATADKFLAIQDKRTVRGKSVKEMTASLGTSVEELEDSFGISFDFEKITTKEQEKIFLNAIFGCESKYLPTLNKRAKEKRALLNGYFTQEKVFGNSTTAMVDVGWLGTTRLMINSILKEEGYPETTFFYYGVRGDVMHSRYGRYHTYNSPTQLSTEGTTLIENYFSASPYPSTIEYKENDGILGPVFPKDCEYKENEIIKANVTVAKWMCNEIVANPTPLGKHFWSWGKQAVEEMLKLNKDVDVTPLMKAAEFDNTAFVRKLTMKEFFNIVCFGGRTTAFDRGSLRITCGKHIFPCIDKIARFTGKIRRRLYLRLQR